MMRVCWLAEEETIILHLDGMGWDRIGWRHGGYRREPGYSDSRSIVREGSHEFIYEKMKL